VRCFLLGHLWVRVPVGSFERYYCQRCLVEFRRVVN
jgi:hypothetical protein